MAYGQHRILTPFQRWGLLVGYWSVAMAIVIPTGLFNNLLEQDWMVMDNWKAIHLLESTAIFFHVWSLASYSFGRRFSLFSTMVYPVGHISDTLLWLTIFDFGRKILPLYPYAGGMTTYSLYVILHRNTLEVSYLPEHHPPAGVRSSNISGKETVYVLAAILSGFLMMAVYHKTNDTKWVVLVKFVQDFFFPLAGHRDVGKVLYSE